MFPNVLCQLMDTKDNDGVLPIEVINVCCFVCSMNVYDLYVSKVVINANKWDTFRLFVPFLSDPTELTTLATLEKSQTIIELAIQKGISGQNLAILVQHALDKHEELANLERKTEPDHARLKFTGVVHLTSLLTKFQVIIFVVGDTQDGR